METPTVRSPFHQVPPKLALRVDFRQTFGRAQQAASRTARDVTKRVDSALATWLDTRRAEHSGVCSYVSATGLLSAECVSASSFSDKMIVLVEYWYTLVVVLHGMDGNIRIAVSLYGSFLGAALSSFTAKSLASYFPIKTT